MSGYAYTPWIWPTLASALFTGSVSLYLWRRRETRGALPLAMATFVMAVWCLTEAAEMAATDFATQRLWFMARDVLTLAGIVIALWFALEYAGLGRLLTRPVVAVLVGSVVVLAPLYIADGGRLLWSRIWWDGTVQGQLAPLGAVFAVYGFVLVLIAVGVLLLLFARSPAHRAPVALILLGQVAIRVAYPLGLLNIAHLPNLPLVVLAFDFATLMYVIALFRFRLFDLVPVARQTIIERMSDSMLALDLQDRIADLNRAAEQLLSVDRPEVIGRSLSEVIGPVSDLDRAIADPATGDEVALPTDDAQRWFQVSGSTLADWQGERIGRLVVLHDITRLKRAEERLSEQERTVAIANERERMARELHDRVGQVLAYLSMQADAVRKLLADGKAEEARGRLGRLGEVAREAHADVRGYIEELQDAAPEPRSFLESLRHELGAFERNFGVRGELRVAPGLDPEALGTEEQSQLLRIVHEALTNARSHGGAAVVRVAIESADGTTRLVVEDDGGGFDVVAAGNDGRGYGLRFMRERAELLGGDLEIESSPGQGTRLIVRIPSAAGASPRGRLSEAEATPVEAGGRPR